MKLAPFPRRVVVIGTLIAGLAIPSAASASTFVPPDTSWCTDPLLSQPFLADGDANQYMLLPGQTPDNFDGTGWTLTGGAQIVTATLADGTIGSVLELPHGATATSPTVCVQEDYPDARARVRDVAGSSGLSFRVSYQGRTSWDSPDVTGRLRGKKSDWSLSEPVHVKPHHIPGWQPVRFTLVSDGPKTETQVYNFYVDPRMKR